MDNNEHGTNLASLGTDCISRQAAIEALEDAEDAFGYLTKDWREVLEQLPPIHPVNNSEMPNSSDVISRQAAIDLLKQMRKDGDMIPWEGKDVFARIRKLPPAQPEIIRCRNCKFASGDSRICMKFGHSPIGELDFCSFAERREVTT